MRIEVVLLRAIDCSCAIADFSKHYNRLASAVVAPPVELEYQILKCMKPKSSIKNAGTPSGRIGFLVPWPPLLQFFDRFCRRARNQIRIGQRCCKHFLDPTACAVSPRLFWLLLTTAAINQVFQRLGWQGFQPVIAAHVWLITHYTFRERESNLLSHCESRGINQSY